MSHPPTHVAFCASTHGGAACRPWIQPAIVVVLLMATATPTTAQGIVGQLFDFDTGIAVVTAEVVVTDEAGDTVGRAISDESGRFVILVQDPGDYSVMVSRLGYVSQVSAEIYLKDDKLLELEMMIQPEAVGIEGLVVTTTPRVESLTRRGFYERKRSSIGNFVQPTDIERIQAFSASGLLRGIPGLVIANGGVGTRRGGSGFRRGCALKVFVDGVDRGINLDEVVIRYHVVAIEVYKSIGTVPGRFLGAVASGSMLGGFRVETCGAVVVWTEVGGR